MLLTVLLSELVAIRKRKTRRNCELLVGARKRREECSFVCIVSVPYVVLPGLPAGNQSRQCSPVRHVGVAVVGAVYRCVDNVDTASSLSFVLPCQIRSVRSDVDSAVRAENQKKRNCGTGGIVLSYLGSMGMLPIYPRRPGRTSGSSVCLYGAYA